MNQAGEEESKGTSYPERRDSRVRWRLAWPLLITTVIGFGCTAIVGDLFGFWAAFAGVLMTATSW